MSLKEYARKRSFSKTPEPKPKKAPAPAGNFYCVQRHHATRLHYDFRLEVDGALVSWAVPKGPTLNPAEKRLAMHVEDHPLDYGNFEGNIPAGNYGAGSVMLWDRGTYELLGDLPAKQQLARGDFKFRLHGQKLQGEFAIVLMKNRGKGNEWLLLKKKDEFADPEWDAEQHSRSVLTERTQEEIARDLPAAPAKHHRSKRSYPKGVVESEMPSSITPMKGTLANSLPPGKDWLYEIKWDGVRAICFIENGAVRMTSRSGKSCERQYPELSVFPRFISAETAVIDAEICALDEQGRPRFSLIQPRIMAADPASVAAMARSKPVTMFVFDLLYLDGHDLRGAALSDRRKLLESIFKEGSPVIRLSQTFDEGEHLLEAAREQGLEGVVAKRAGSRYEARRSDSWIKIKTVSETECVICGYTLGEREFFGALILGVYEKKRLVWAGNVGTGFDQKLIEQIYNRLQPLKTSKCPFAERPKLPKDVVWVRPELVCTIRYAEWTPDGRLRAPVFVGLRTDIDPKESMRESTPPPGPLLPGKEAQAILTIDGKELKFTNLNKAYYPEDGYTKRDVLNYYDAVADLILPHLQGRPLSLKRYPNGIHGDFFFQKRSSESFPTWLRTESIYSEHNKAPINYAVADDRASLLYLTNLGCIDQNPWMSRVGSLDKPDYILIDLDPYECSFDKIVEVALLVREKLELIGMVGYPKTTGGDGMHIYIPIENRYSYEQARTFAEILGMIVTQDKPSLFTTPRAVAKREKGRVYFDYLQISEGKTISAPYVLRAYEGAPVSTPLEWSEVKRGLSPKQFHLGNALERFARVGDLFEEVLSNRQRLENHVEKLESLLREAAEASMIARSALDLIGETPIVELSRIHAGPGRILAKAEFLQPGGSVKDRAARKAIELAYQDGRLKPNQPVVEMTSGNMGSALAAVCAVTGNPFIATMSEGNSPERAKMMRGLGAEVILVPQVDGSPGKVTGKDIAAAIQLAIQVAKERNAFYVDQFNNPASIITHEQTTGPEIWRAVGSDLGGFVAAIGSGGTFVGIARYLKSQNPAIVCAPVEPAGAEILAGRPVTKADHILQGTGYGLTPPLWQAGMADLFLSVTDDEASTMRADLGLREGLYIGFSAAANVCAAKKLIETGRLGGNPTVVTILCDTGLKY